MSGGDKRYFHYGICTVLNHPEVNGNWDLWAAVQDGKFIIVRREIHSSHKEIRAAYRLDYAAGEITYQVFDKPRPDVIAKRNPGSNQEIYIQRRLTFTGPAWV